MTGTQPSSELRALRHLDSPDPPALVGGLSTRWFHRWPLIAGRAVGMVYGTLAAYGVAGPTQAHFGGSNAEIPLIGEIGYIGTTAFVLDVLVTVAATILLRAVRAPDGIDETRPDDYAADAGDPPNSRVGTAASGREERAPVA